MAHIYFPETANLSLLELERLRRAEYDMIGTVRCPLLDSAIVKFGAVGFNHLLRDGRGRYRNEKEQRERLNLLPLVPGAIVSAPRFGSNERKGKLVTNNRKKTATFYRLFYPLGYGGEKYELAIILYVLGSNGAPHFYSVFKVNQSQRPKAGGNLEQV